MRLISFIKKSSLILEEKSKMNYQISGTITSIFPSDINTDDIIPAWTLQESTDQKFFAKYAFENSDPQFIVRCSKEKNNIIIAGENFGCGSSREQAVYALQENNVIAVIAKSFSDIFYRNALNNGLVLITSLNTKDFANSQELEIDLLKRTINCNGKEIKFVISKSDADTFATGGKLNRVRNHLKQIIQKDKIITVKKIPQKTKPQTIVEKIISDHLGKNVFVGDFIKELPVDTLFFNEVIGPPVIKYFHQYFDELFKKNKMIPEVFNPKEIFLIPDHTVPSSSVSVSEGIDLMEAFAEKQGIKCYKEGDGIEHIVLMEDGFITPGKIILGTDSHTDTNGALNCLAFGIGTTDAAYALATGHLYDFTVPKTFRINLTGELHKGVYGKDLILFLIGMLGVDGTVKQVVEFGGFALKTLSMDARTTVANMAVEMGARTAIFESDEILQDYLSTYTKKVYKTYLPDKRCRYSKIIEVNLSELEPNIAFPHKPGNVTSVSKIKQFMEKTKGSKNTDCAEINSLKITDAFLGACTNGKYEDFLAAAIILKDKKIHPGVNFIVIPASRKIYNRLLTEGILKIFADAGANIESSNCGPCFGKHMGVVGKGAQIISSSNRNYIGRMGSKKAKIFLASPATVTASAVAGEITDPRNFL